MKSYKDLEIYTQAFDLAVRIYFMTIKLPHPDKFEPAVKSDVQVNQ